MKRSISQFIRFQFLWITIFLILFASATLYSSPVENKTESIDSIDTALNKKIYQVNGYSIGLFYGNYFHSSASDPTYYARKTLKANLYNFAFKFRQSLFEFRFGLGIGNTSEQRVYYHYSHYPPNFTIERLVDDVDEGLYEFNLQARVNISNRFRLCPYLWLGYSHISYSHDNYSNVDSYHFGAGLQYRLSGKFILEASTAFSAWDDEDKSDAQGYTPASYFEIGIYKTIDPYKK